MTTALAPTGQASALNEEARLKEVLDFDSGAIESLNQVCLLAQRLFNVPIALVTILGCDKQTLLAKCGVNAISTAHKDAFCSWTIQDDDVFVVRNAIEDPRFAHNPLVTGKMQVRFYAGAPLSMRAGLSLGALCLKDTKPRQFGDDDASLLKMLAAIVVNELQRRRAIIDLQRQRELLCRTESLSRIGSWALNPTTNEVIWSAQMYRLLELDAATKPTLDLMLRLSIIPCWDLLRKAIRRGKGDRAVFEGEVQIPTVNKTPRFVRCIARPETTGKVTRITGNLQDITEQKRVERIKTEFISTVSHELRTPLTSIMGSLGLLRSRAVGQLSEQSEHMVRVAHDNGTRLANLINDIITIEKIEAGHFEYKYQTVPLKSVIERAAVQTSPYATQYGATIVVDAPPRGVLLETDPDRFQQAMDNLISNAAKYSSKGGQIRIGAKSIGKIVRISVSDQGPGIPHKFRALVFEKFAQADSSDTRAKGGTGLGLSIAKAIVESLGGELGFDTEIGVGTTFFFDLPRRRTAPDKESAAHECRHG